MHTRLDSVGLGLGTCIDASIDGSIHGLFGFGTRTEQDATVIHRRNILSASSAAASRRGRTGTHACMSSKTGPAVAFSCWTTLTGTQPNLTDSLDFAGLAVCHRRTDQILLEMNKNWRFLISLKPIIVHPTTNN